MVIPTYLSLSEAAKRLADKSGEAVTPKWLIGLASEGRLTLYFQLHTPIFLAPPNVFHEPGKYVSPGDWIPIEKHDAKAMHAILGDGAGSYPFPTLRPDPDTKRGAFWVQDPWTDERKPLEVRFDDLGVASAEVDRLATHSYVSKETPEERRQRFLRMQREGMKIADIARREELSRSRVNQILGKARNRK